MGPGSAEQRKSAAPRLGHGSAVRESKKKGGPEKPSLVRADLCAQVPGYIPTPPRATTKLFDLTLCNAAPAPGENRRGIQCADTSRPAPIANRIVNLRLTTQSRGPRPQKASAAWTLQSLSCTTARGMRVRESGTELSRRAIRGGKAKV